MPQADKVQPGAEPPRASRSEWEGRSLATRSPEALEFALRTAADYRGDVTLEFSDGSRVEGYLHNYDLRAGQAALFAKTGPRDSELRTLSLATLTSIHFTGPDPAFGKSWDDWTAKSMAQREAEAQRLAEAARQRGEL